MLAWLRSKCPTVAALSTAISRVRKAMIARCEARCEVARAALTPFAHEEGVDSFLKLPLGDMLRVQRQHCVDPTWSAAAEAALASIELLPSNVAALKLTPRELLELQRTHDSRLLAKQERIMHVHRASLWLAHTIELCRASHAGMSIERLVLPLLLLSGRRTTELLNGRSTFAPTPRPTTSMFSGALKKRGGGTVFEIPLLCDHATFAHGLAALREAQRFEQLSEEACHNKYCHSLAVALPSLYPWAPTVHGLRSAYAAFVFQLYACDCTFNRACMRALGHEKLEVSLAYASCKLHDVAPLCFGPLP